MNFLLQGVMMTVAAVAGPTVSANHAVPGSGCGFDHGTVSLVCETSAVSPGSTANIAIMIEMEEGWHVYWNGVNDSGTPPAFELQLPEGWAAADAIWPAPLRHVSPGDLLDHVYEGRLLVIVPVTIPSNAKVGEERIISATVDYLICKDVCMPESSEVSLALKVAETSTPSAEAEHFKTTRNRLPKALDPTAADCPKVTQDGNHLVVEDSRATGLAFFPGPQCPTPSNLVVEGEVEGGALRVSFGLPLEWKQVNGILEVRRKDGSLPIYYAIPTGHFTKTGK